MGDMEMGGCWMVLVGFLSWPVIGAGWYWRAGVASRWQALAGMRRQFAGVVGLRWPIWCAGGCCLCSDLAVLVGGGCG